MFKLKFVYHFYRAQSKFRQSEILSMEPLRHLIEVADVLLRSKMKKRVVMKVIPIPCIKNFQISRMAGKAEKEGTASVNM